MSGSAPRSIDEYLQRLRAALSGEDPALIQDALYDAEEYLRAEVAAHAGKPEAEALDTIVGTYGTPDEIAAAYRATEVKVKTSLATPARRPSATDDNVLRGFFAVYSDPRAYASLFFMLLSMVTGIFYFTLVITGLSLSVGLAVLIIGVPFFLAFIGVVRAMALGEGLLLEAITGERLTVGSSGSVRALKSSVINGMTVTEGAPVIGIALESSSGGTVIPVHVTLR
jgi:uncharacterized membrane protein